MAKEIKPKPKSRESEAMKQALQTYQSTIDDRVNLVDRLEHYRDGCSDAEWVIIHKAIQHIKIKIDKMRDMHGRLSKTNE